MFRRPSRRRSSEAEEEVGEDGEKRGGDGAGEDDGSR